MITIKMTTIMMAPRTFVRVSIADFAFLKRKTTMAMAAAMTYPMVVGIPSRVFRPSEPPPTLPMLKTRPPSTTMKDTK